MTILFTAFFLLFPALAIWLCYRYQFINKIGAVVLCYIGGITIGNSGLLPADFDSLQKTLSEVSIVTALPFLLYSMDIKKWSRLAGKTILSFALATAAIVIVAFIAYIGIKNYREDGWKLAGMAIGVYTGGTPNLAAIKAALGVDATTFIIFHTYDTIISLIYIIFCATVAQRLFLKFLPAFKKNGDGNGESGFDTEDIHAFAGIFTAKTIPLLALALLITVGIIIASVGTSLLFPKQYATTIIILMITSLGIGLSFIKKIRSIEKTFQTGMYIIYVFCVTVGSMANFSLIVNINYPLLVFVTFSVFAGMSLHAFFCYIFKVDADTFIITSVSAVCSPPFVPVVAAGLKNKEVIISGITTGIIGYAVGNYLGISLAYLFQAF